MDFSFENETSIPKTNSNKIFTKEDSVFSRKDSSEIINKETNLNAANINGLSDIDLSN
jgi:hypothetical protein